MSSTDWTQVASLFEAASDLPKDEIPKFLASISDMGLRQEVASLLPHLRRQSDFLEGGLTFQVAEDFALPKFSAGESVNQFVFLKEVGAGSFGTVYLAHDKGLERTVAIKVTPLSGLEAQAMAHLEHDHIVRIFSETLDTEKKIRFICMQYIAGCSLAEHFEQENEFSVSECLTIIRDLSDALASAHKRGVIHLDIKPENILLDEEKKSYLTDFNVASISERPGNLLGGTRRYMAPEQEEALFAPLHPNSEKLDERADIFSLGVVFRETLQKCRTVKISPRLSEAIDGVITTATQSSRDLRFPTSSHFKDEMDKLIHYARVLERMPANTVLDTFLLENPRRTLFLSILIPEILGSLVNITYNATRIVSALTQSQQEVFRTSIIILNPILYGVGLFFIIRLTLPLFRFVSSGKGDEHQIAYLSAFAPRAIGWIITVAWAASAILFPLLIHVFSPPLGMGTLLHFIISFFLSWLIAVTYSLLNCQYFCTRYIYPRLWRLTAKPNALATHQLRVMEDRIKIYPVIAGAVPMVGALLMILVGPESLGTPSYALYRLLLISFVVMALGGMLYAMFATRKVLSVLYALRP